MIVVVDDDPGCRAVAAGMLSAAGFDVSVASGGVEALSLIAERRPELVLLDTQMPEMDGIETYRRMKQNETTREVPVVLAVPHGDAGQRAMGLRMGAADFVSKPFEQDELIARVRVQLELARLRLDLEKRVEEQTSNLRAAQDALERKLAESARNEAILRAREEGFRELADRAPIGVWVMGSDQRLLFHNKCGLSLSGRAKHQLAGDEWTRIVHPDDLNLVRQKYAMAVAERRAFRIEYRVRGPNGGVRWVLNTGIPHFAGKDFVGHIGTTIDITDFKRSQERMVIADKLESLECLAAGIAHDFNNVVGSIFAAAELALTDLPADSPARANIERINAAAGRAAAIVNMLMTYAGEYGMRSDRLDLSLVVAEIIELLKGTLPSKIVLKMNLAHGLPEIRASVTQVRHVILNLVMNAFEAIDSSAGMVHVATDWLQIDPETPERNAAPGDYCRLLVTDTGCGISPGVRGKIFDPFYSTKFIGRGLGLAVVHGIVRSLGGAINITSSPGEGSTFEILLPCTSRTGVAVDAFRTASGGHLTPSS